jgi:hypothetical protein
MQTEIVAATGVLGRPGRLPTRASHRTGRARFGHPAPQVMVLLRGRWSERSLGKVTDT